MVRICYGMSCYSMYVLWYVCVMVRACYSTYVLRYVCVAMRKEEFSYCPSAGDSVSTVEIFNPTRNCWLPAASMCTLRSRVGVCVLSGKMYAIGGYNGVERLDTVEVFDPEKECWKLVAPLTCPRRYILLSFLSNPSLMQVSL